MTSPWDLDLLPNEVKGLAVNSRPVLLPPTAPRVPQLSRESCPADQCGGDYDFWYEVLCFLSSSNRTKMAELKEAYDSGDIMAMRCTAHALKGAAEACFVKKLKDEAYELERCCWAMRRQRVDDVSVDVSVASELVNRVREEGRRLQATLDGLAAMGEKPRTALLKSVAGYVEGLVLPQGLPHGDSHASAAPAESDPARAGPHAQVRRDSVSLTHAKDQLTKLKVSKRPRNRDTSDVVSVLVVDDSEVTSMLLKKGLEGLGLQTSMADSAEAALDFICGCESLPDVVVLDCYFKPSRMTGFEVCLSLRESGLTKEKLPILMMSSRSSSAHVQQAFAAGVNDCVQKPATAPEIAARIRALLGDSEAGQPPASKRARADTSSSPGPELQPRVPSVLRDSSPAVLCDGDFEFWVEILAALATSLRARIVDLESAAASGDVNAMCLLAHALKGAAEACFVGKLKDLAFALEQFCWNLRDKGRGGAPAAVSAAALSEASAMAGRICDEAARIAGIIDRLSSVEPSAAAAVLEDAEGYVEDLHLLPVSAEEAAASQPSATPRAAAAAAPNGAGAAEGGAGAAEGAAGPDSTRAALLAAAKEKLSVHARPSHRHEHISVNVLAVDDSEVAGLLLKKGMDALGLETTVADSAEAALDYICSSESLPDVLLLDCYFKPSCMTGFEVCQALRESGLTKEKLPILMMSSRSSSAHVQQAFAAGVNDCVQKPATASEIAARITGILNIDLAATAKKKKSANWWCA